MTQNDQIKIGDFGIARVLQHTYDCAQTAIGTPYYLSPEICQEKPYNQKSDIWSLGCILYEMVTLRHAFDANSMKGLVLKILRGSYPAIPSTYSQDLKDLVADMLIKDPKQRPSMRKILEKEFLSKRISKLLTSTIQKTEFTETFVKKHLKPYQNKVSFEKYDSQQENNEESKDGSSSDLSLINDSSIVSKSQISQQKLVAANKEAIKKKRRLEVLGGSEDDQDFVNHLKFNSVAGSSYFRCLS